MKKNVISILALFVVTIFFFSGCGAEKAAAEKNTTLGFCDWVTYNTQGELTSAADIIIEGVVTNTNSGVKSQKNYVFPDTILKADKDKALTAPSSTIIETVSEVKIVKVLKGDVKEGSKININQLGGETETAIIVIDQVKYFKKGESHFFFIKNINGIYSTLNPDQGDILYDGDTILSKPNNPIFTEKTTSEMREKIQMKIQ